MSTSPHHSDVAPVEMLVDWTGPAINDPASAEPKDSRDEVLAGPLPALSDAAIWVRVTLASAMLGNGVYEALKAKVVGYLAARRGEEGQCKLDELKRRVLEEIRMEYGDSEQAKLLSNAIDHVFDSAAQ